MKHRNVIDLASVILLILLLVPSSDGFAQKRTAVAINDSARNLIAHGAIDSALVVVRKALVGDSANVDLLLTLAEAQKAKRQSQARRSTLERVLQIQPLSVEASLAMAEDFFGAHKLDSAKQYALAALTNSQKSSADSYYLLGRIHEQSNQPDSALYYYRGAWAVLPWDNLF